MKKINNVINSIMTKYFKYICLFLMILGTSAHAWSAITEVTRFESETVVTSNGYGSSYGYYSSDWDLSMGGGGDRAGFNASNHTTIGNAYGTSANTSHDGFYIRSKNKIDNICQITFTYSMATTAAECDKAKIYLGYSTDGSSWSAIPLTSGTQGESISSPEWDGESGSMFDYHATVWTFEFSKITSAYYAIIISRNGKVESDKGFAFAETHVTFYSGCCEELDKPTGLTVTQNVDGTHGKTRLGWNAVTNASGYVVSITKNGTTTNTYERTVDQLYLKGDLPAGNYTWSVYAKGNGDPYCEENPAQDGTPFCIGADLTAVTPSNLSATPLSTTSARISWDAVTGAEYYEVEIKNGSGTTITSDILAGTSWTATGLSPNTTYRVFWKAVNICDDAYNSAVNSSYTFTITAHTVQFDLNGKGSGKPSDQTILHGNKAAKPSDPTPPSGWLFGGWYKESSCTNAWNFSTDVVNADQTLYAKWIERIYNQLDVAVVDHVTISATSPSVTEGNHASVEAGTTITLNYSGVETSAGYSWSGWNVYKTSDPSTKVTVTSNQFTMPDYAVTVSAYIFGDLVAFCEPEIEITLEQTDGTSAPLYITSAAGQKVKAIRTLDLTVDGAAGDATQDVTLSGTDLLFYKTDGTQITGNVLQTDGSGDLATTKIVVAYAPSAYVDESFATPTITVTCNGQNKAFNNLVTGRCLPQYFVIAAKAGSEWVALTAKISGMSTQDAVPIRVDNTTTPTKASVALNTSEYSLLGLPTTNSRYASNGEAIHFLSSQTSKVLNATKNTSAKTYINTGANPANAASSDSCLFYEWKLVSSDLVHYTVTNCNTNASLVSNRVLGYSTGSGKWGMYTSSNANQDIFLLPIEEVLTDLDVEVMEWGATSMALRFPGDATVPSTIKVTLGGSTSAAKTLAAIGDGSDIYKVEGLSLTGNNCEIMQITDGADASRGSLIRKPILVSSAVNGSAYTSSPGRDVCENCDIVILSTGKLTANENKASNDHVNFANIYVYPGGKLILEAKSLGVKQQVYVRGGYSWLNTNTYTLPEIYLNGNINFNGSAGIIYDYYIQNYQYYQFALPYSVPLAKVTDEAGVDNFPVWVKHYNGALRAADANATSWEWYEGTNFEAGTGYIIAARPRQVAKVQNRPLSIIRFPLTNTAFNGSGEATKSVSTTAHGISGYNANPRTVTANNVGWNFVGNPFMSTWKGDIGHQQLVKDPDKEHWNGSYKWVDAATKYITIMSAVSGNDYDQYVASTTELKPFFPFFFQETAVGGSGTLEFSNGNRIKKAPSMLRAAEPRDAYVQIEISDATDSDRTGLFVSDKYSDEIDFDDSEKLFGTATDKPKVWLMHDDTRLAFEEMTENRAAGSVPLGFRAPTTGEYTFYINEDDSKLAQVKAVLLTDNAEGVMNYDLMNSSYVFNSDAIQYNDTRFTVRIVLKDENQGSATGTENINLKSEQPTKFIYHNQLYILRNGVIYDATGKRMQ